jgi:drug/metabolite transporter (DMT)-like permease
MNQVTAANGGAVTVSGGSLKAIVTNVTVWGGLVLFGLSALVWLFVLSRTSLSFAYPFAALTYLLIVLVDRFVLHEAVPPLRWLGVGFIMVGIVLVARTAPA